MDKRVFLFLIVLVAFSVEAKKKIPKKKLNQLKGKILGERYTVGAIVLFLWSAIIYKTWLTLACTGVFARAIQHEFKDEK